MWEKCWSSLARLPHSSSHFFVPSFFTISVESQGRAWRATRQAVGCWNRIAYQPRIVSHTLPRVCVKIGQPLPSKSILWCCSVQTSIAGAGGVSALAGLWDKVSWSHVLILCSIFLIFPMFRVRNHDYLFVSPAHISTPAVSTSIFSTPFPDARAPPNSSMTGSPWLTGPLPKVKNHLETITTRVETRDGVLEWIESLEGEVTDMLEGWRGAEEGEKSPKGTCERFLLGKVSYSLVSLWNSGLISWLVVESSCEGDRGVGQCLQCFRELGLATRMLNHRGITRPPT